MRLILNVAAGLLLVVGVVWAGQGAGYIAGSFMTGDRLWLRIGVASIVVGSAMLAVVNRSRRRP